MHKPRKGCPAPSSLAIATVAAAAALLLAGCNDYDTKPIELDRLLAKMQALLPAAP